jgi:hypothetical protein
MEGLIGLLFESAEIQPTWKNAERSIAKDYAQWVEEVKKSVNKAIHNADVAKSFSTALTDWLVSKGHTAEELANDPDWAISGKKFFNGDGGGVQIRFKWGGVLTVRVNNGSITFSETTGSFKKS